MPEREGILFNKMQWFTRPFGCVVEFTNGLPNEFDFSIEFVTDKLLRHNHPSSIRGGLTQYELVIGGNGYILVGNERERIQDGKKLNGKQAFNIWKPGDIHGYEADPNNALIIMTVSYPAWKPECDNFVE